MISMANLAWPFGTNARQELFLARDRMGIRPLFYTQDGSRLIFASEIKAIFADPTTQRSLDLQTLSDVFTCWSATGDHTAFEGINQLMPANYALINRNGMKTRRYWQLTFAHDRNGRSTPR